MKNGIDLNDCEKVNNSINALLDTVDYIKEQYFLEISSPGVERVLRKKKHFENNLGNMVIINLFKPVDGKKQIEGILNRFDDDNLYILINENEVSIDKRNISFVKTKFEW